MYLKYLSWREVERIDTILDEPPLPPKAEAMIDVSYRVCLDGWMHALPSAFLCTFSVPDQNRLLLGAFLSGTASFAHLGPDPLRMPHPDHKVTTR